MNVILLSAKNSSHYKNTTHISGDYGGHYKVQDMYISLGRFKVYGDDKTVFVKKYEKF